VSMVAATMEAVRTAKAQLQAAIKDPKTAWVQHCAKYGPHMLQDGARFEVRGLMRWQRLAVQQL
jgi:hypothetical protein